MAASQEDARNIRRERVLRMTELNSSLLFSLLEWGAETNYSIQTVTATVLKYPLQILEGVYTNLCAAREDFRAKNKFRRRRRRRKKRRKNKQARGGGGDDDDGDEVDPASVTTTTRLQFLEQEILRLRAAMEKEVATKEEDGSPVKATFVDDENQAANDAAAAAAVAAVAAAMANVAAAQTAAGPRTPPRKSKPTPTTTDDVVATPSQEDANAAIAAAVAAATAQASAAASEITTAATTTPETCNMDSPSAPQPVDNFDTAHETIRRDGLICLQDIRSGVQLRKPRQRRPSKKALAKTTPTNPRRMTIADLIRESNAKIGAAMRMHEWSPEEDHHKDKYGVHLFVVQCLLCIKCTLPVAYVEKY